MASSTLQKTPFKILVLNYGEINMAVKMRLRRMGSKNAPFYRVVVQDSRRAPTGRFIETIGWYDPKQDGTNFSLNIERIDYWVSKGAQPSETVNSLIKKAKTVSSNNSISASIPEKEIPQEVIVEETNEDEDVPVNEENNEASESSEEG